MGNVMMQMRRPTPAGALIITIEAGECCAKEPCCGRRWPDHVDKPSFVDMSSGNWEQFCEKMSRLVKSYGREGISFVGMVVTFIVLFVLLHPTFGVLRPAFDWESSASEDGRNQGLLTMVGLLIFGVFLSVFIHIGWMWWRISSNQKVDAQIDELLAQVSRDSGAIFTLERLFTQVCKPKGARTYRAVCIAPAGSWENTVPSAVVHVNQPPVGVPMV